MNSLQAAALLVLLGAVAIVAGVALLFGTGVALVVGGVLAVIAGVAVYDPADRTR